MSACHRDVGLALLGTHEEDESTELSPSRQMATEKVKGGPRQPQHRHCCYSLPALLSGLFLRHRHSTGSCITSPHSSTPQRWHWRQQISTTELGSFTWFHQPFSLSQFCYSQDERQGKCRAEFGLGCLLSLFYLQYLQCEL